MSKRIPKNRKTARSKLGSEQVTPVRRRTPPKAAPVIAHSKTPLAFGGMVHAVIRDRWQSNRPFAGHTEDSLRRKVRSPAIANHIKEQAQRELALREGLIWL
ncbi:hypothetical protein LOK46_32355 (plasmid) [Methylobacterium sp. NMS14P]|uniref:hypothetical protein n=1 Tax=Methylobacterium sp. NMS14P TaxID=2894310 RepID=UPI002359D363|nr:hypothetical protein [Methylobacterium sp. NMS14P]WCS28885.1 hypothetical protein LOK46_32355 [Methylobacterium sp. NMS14P]